MLIECQESDDGLLRLPDGSVLYSLSGDPADLGHLAQRQQPEHHGVSQAEPGRVGCVRAVEENVVDGAFYRRRVTGVEESSRHWLRRCLVRDPSMESLIIHQSRGAGQWRDQWR